jgi:hypothetical protein
MSFQELKAFRKRIVETPEIPLLELLVLRLKVLLVDIRNQMQGHYLINSSIQDDAILSREDVYLSPTLTSLNGYIHAIEISSSNYIAILLGYLK